MTETCAVILAAGEGKRMKSNRPKVLSPVLFKPMLRWVIDACLSAGVEELCVVAGHRHEEVEEYLASVPAKLSTALQLERKGTGHAVMMADAFLKSHGAGQVLILCGDAPFIDSSVIKEALHAHIEGGNAVTVISSVLSDPTGYGRILRDEQTGCLHSIIEQKDADEKQRAVCEVNSGAYWFDTDALLSVLYSITNSNTQNEYYLTDAIKLLIDSGRRAGVFTAPNADTVLGANDCVQLNSLNEIARGRVLESLMLSGVEIPCKDGILIGPDVTIGSGTCILPGTILRGCTQIGSGCVIGPNSFIENCQIGDTVTLNAVQCTNCEIASGTVLGPFSAVGNLNIRSQLNSESSRQI